jgi:hypothetical protein
MAQIVSQRQGFAGKGTKLMGIIAVAFIAIAVALAVWAAFAASAPKVAPSTKAVPYLQDPGLLDQRAGERGPHRHGAGAQPAGPGHADAAQG